MGTVSVVRPYCNNEQYWQVYFDTNQAITDVGAETTYPMPETRQFVRRA